MNTNIRLIAAALGIAMLLLLAVGPAVADCPIATIPHEWLGGGGDNLWTTHANWDPHSPSGPNGDASACLQYQAVGYNLCEYGTYLGNHPWGITVFGQSPTFFTFNIQKDICPASFDLQDYSYLDVDDCVDTGSTDLSGRVNIDVAFGVECCLGSADVEDESAILDRTGQVIFETLTVTAENGSQSIRLILDGSGTVLANETRIEAEWDTNQTAYTAEVHLKDGLFKTNDLLIWAGQSNDRRVSLDLDNSMTVRNKTTMDLFDVPGVDGGGRVFIDVVVGATLDLGELYIGGPCILKVTGIGLPGVKGQVVTSANEAAAANTCTCSCP